MIVSSSLIGILLIILGLDYGKIDLLISEMYVNRQSIFGIFIEDYGETPGWMIGIITAVLPRLKKIELTGIINAVSVIVPVVSISVLFYLHSLSIFLVILSITIILILLINRIELSDEVVVNFNKLTLSMLIFIPGVIVGTMKLFWGRVRYRHLDDNFTPWYKINGITGNQSFPSGHTAMGIMVFPLFIIINSMKIQDNLKLLLKIILIIWSIAVAIGRVIIGAHYATDVLFSVYLGIVGYIYFSDKLIKK